MSARAKVPLSRYQRNKANFLHQFGIYLTEGQERALQALKSEIAVDNWARKLIMDVLSGEPMQTLLRPLLNINYERKEAAMSDFYPEETILRPMTYQDAILILQNVNPERGDIWSQMEQELRKWVRENGAEMFNLLDEHQKDVMAAAFPNEKPELKNDPAFPNGRAAEFAAEIVKFLKENHLWFDVRVYFNQMCFATDNGKGTGTMRASRTETNGPLYFIPDIDPRDYFQYVNPNHILSMSFEGPFYECLNGYAGDYGYEIEAEFRQLLQKYGCYYELGDAWNLSVYKM